jgi:hypothetical protein
MVGGVEDFRSAHPQITGEGSIIAIPGGDYAVTCFITKDPESTSGAPTERQLKAVLGEGDYRYYRRSAVAGLWGYVGFLLVPFLWPITGWMWALGTGILVVYCHIGIQDKLRERNVRYQAVKRRAEEVWQQAARSAAPTFVLVMRRIADRGKLQGGVVSF